MVKFKLEEKGDLTVIEFELEGPISPDTLANLNPPHPNPQKGVVISGRGPIWLFCYLAHEYHYCRWVGTFDPRLGGAVVVQSHDPDVEVGEVVEIA